MRKICLQLFWTKEINLDSNMSNLKEKNQPIIKVLSAVDGYKVLHERKSLNLFFTENIYKGVTF